jgi:hypothetical protein
MNLTIRCSLTLLLLVAVVTAVPSASACPGCKEAVAATDDENGTPANDFSEEGAAYSYSVLFMLGMMATLLGVFGTAFYRLTRKNSQFTSPSQS